MKKKRTRKPRRKNYYFTSVHEDAIVQYTKSTCNIERTKLYESLIQPALSEMVDKITYTYKFTSLPNIDSLREECKIWLTTILDKYNKDKGSKAFSYFSVITKNWFIHKVKTTSKKMKSEVSFEAAAGEIEEKYLSTTNDYGIKREQREFWHFLLKEIEDWSWEEEKNNALSNDMRVLRAISELLSSPQEIDILNKKAIYLYIREITGLTTKQIANSLKKYRVRYRAFTKEWNNGKI